MGGTHHWFNIELPRDKFTEADRGHLQALFPEVDVILVDRTPRMVPNPDDVDYAEAHWDD